MVLLESSLSVAENLIREGLDIVDIPVVRAKCLDSRQTGKPGIMQIEVKKT